MGSAPAVAALLLISLWVYSAAGAHCNARVPDEQFADRIPKNCRTCSCASSTNAEFYDPSKPETCCGASEAKYRVKFTGTWRRNCHSDYFFNPNHWSPMTGVSHDHTYEVWNACMNNVSLGVALVSQTGSVTTIENEYRARGDSVKDIFGGSLIDGNGTTMDEFSVNCSYPYVSALTMLVPSVDRMVGVAGLKLCDGDSWKDYVKVCAELFSTATKSERVAPRNSIQFKNCSFGYFEFELQESTEITPHPESCTCQPKVPESCPNKLNVNTRKVCSCCCNSSENVKFYLPKGPNPVCRATGEPEYRVRFKSTWTEEGHPNYYTPTAHWSPLTGVSHDPSYEVWNGCMFNVSEGVALVSQRGSVGTIEAEYAAQGDLVKDTILGARIDKDGETSDDFVVDSSHNYVSVLTMLAPSVDQMVGVSRLDLCDDDGWKKYVKVCAELFSTATKSERVGIPNTIQMNNCSFGYFTFELLEGEERHEEPPQSCTCQPKVAAKCPCEPSVNLRKVCSCCCTSSENVEFYQPNGPNPVCSATGEPEYRVHFKSTWTEEGHPNYYTPTAHWSPLTGVSHDPSYEVWNGCMFNVSEGVALVSQLGSVGTIEAEYAAQGDLVKDTILGARIDKDGETSDDFVVDSSHNYVSVLTMLAPSVDQMVGVSRLDLCDDDGWKKYVKVCAELFSTATKSERVGIPNTIQLNNCSFGYFTFELLEGEERHEEPPQSCTCQPKVAAKCPCEPNVNLRRVCSCCCTSSENVEFYQPNGPNPVCSATGEPEYRVHFKSTWTKEGHPNYYTPTAHWSPLTGVSHDPSYEVWNGCMFNVSEGVALVSQLGSVGTIEAEYAAQGDLVKDTILGARIDKDGETSDDFVVDSSHNYVSVLTMLAPSVDQMVGVSRLDLCDDDGWKKYVKVCAELFSTATKSERVGIPNTIQMNNCSFGYFTFELLEGEERHEEPPQSCTCQPKVPANCPSEPNVDERKVGCCCSSSENVEFYQPNGPNPVCNAAGEPEFRVRFKSTWTEEGHPNYYVPTAHWSPLTGVSHDPSYEVWNGCMFNVSEGVALVSQLGSVGTIEAEYAAQGDLVKDTILGARIDEDGETNVNFFIDSSHNYVSVLTMLAPSVDQMVGVSRLDLCKGDKWKRHIKVCAELFSTATKSERVGIPNTIQMNNCSFGYFEFRNLEPSYNTGFKLRDFNRRFCRSIDFSVLVNVLRGYRTYDDPMYYEYYSLTVRVAKRYKGSRRIKRRSTIKILVSDLPDSMLRANGKPRKGRALFMGYRDSDSNLVVRENGYLEAYKGVITERKGRAC